MIEMMSEDGGNMFQIALCDNEKESLQQTLNAVRLFFEKNPEIHGEIKTFESSGELLDYWKAYKGEEKGSRLLDVYILDIMMPKINGIELGKQLRALGENTPIVYLTSFEEYGYQAFGVQARDYLLKPVDSQKLVMVLEDIYSSLKKEKADLFCVKAKEGIHNISLWDLIYVELIERSIVYHMRDGSILTGLAIRGRFEEEVVSIKENSRFIQPHKSYLVNMQYIKDFMANELIMEDGTLIPISRRRRGEIKKIYLKYLACTTMGKIF